MPESTRSCTHIMGALSTSATSPQPHRTLTENEQRQLLKVTSERRDGYRDHVLYSMALATGLREHELAGLEVGDVFEADGKARKRIALRVFKRSSGAQTQQDVIVPRAFARSLRSSGGGRVGARKPRAGRARCSPATGVHALSTRQLRHGFAVWQRRAGFDRHVSFHVCATRPARPSTARPRTSASPSALPATSRS
jgi:integrase/recombinase XerC